MWIDVHAHLDRLPAGTLSNVLHDAARAGVGTIVSTATDLSSSEEVSRQCREFPSLYGAAGISPFDTNDQPGDWEARLRALFDENKRIVAVGEIGLDGSNPRYPSLDRQLPFFERQLAIAAEYGLTAVIHSRGVEKRAAELCRERGIKKALFHCFTGDREALKTILDAGYYISLSGIITFSSPVGELAALVPSERLFIETDTPYLAPVPHRGKTNCPAWAGLVGEMAARLKGITPESLQAELERNFKRLFLDAG